jgi:hypothetical protein
LHLIPLLLACSGSPPEAAPTPTPEPAPVARNERPEPDDYQPIRAPLEPPKGSNSVIDLDNADPMAIVEAKGPGGEPLESLSLIVASRGDGEIEPCG